MSGTLNLARKWRPQTFNEVVGQGVAINMLRNSLYKNHFFPVYLFAGQKGCGKTSTARILAAAVNCQQLHAFQQAPDKNPLPCLQCSSCIHMQQGAHPDFVEIDAASHTGVDDVRMLLESCSFMPLMGTKKIYLIDEAHMLSKAAFNAFLKILEEPPAHTLFMLATTEILKIPDTVRSRCFQLHFSAIKTGMLLPHLQAICSTEHIAAEHDALSLIVQETDGSARDALNLLEQVRFAHAVITADTVRSVLGIISSNRMGELLALMLEHNTAALLAEVAVLNTIQLNTGKTWHLLLQLIRALIWQAYSVPLADDSAVIEQSLHARIMAATTVKDLHLLLNYLWRQEELFLSTPYKQAFLEKLFLDIALGTAFAPPASGITFTLSSSAQSAPQKQPPHAPAKPSVTHPTPTPIPAPAAKLAPVQPAPQAPPLAHHPESNEPWPLFCKAIEQLGDPILNSIFNQARVASLDQATGTVTLTLAHASPFFLEKITDSASKWRPALQSFFAGYTQIKITTQGSPLPPTPRQPEKPIIPQPKAPSSPPARPQQQPAPAFQKGGFTPRSKKGPETEKLSAGSPLILNDDNKAQWPYTTLLSSLFPGKLELIASPLKR